MHSGSLSFGHYYTYIKSFTDGRWYKFNDEWVSAVDEKVTRATIFGAAGWRREREQGGERGRKEGEGGRSEGRRWESAYAQRGSSRAHEAHGGCCCPPSTGTCSACPFAHCPAHPVLLAHRMQST